MSSFLPYFWKTTLPHVGFLVDSFFSFSTLSVSVYCLLASKMSQAKSADGLIEESLYVTSFSLAAFKILPLCPTLCNPKDCSLQGSSVHGILQARIWEWAGKNTHWGWLHIPKYKELFAPGIIRDLIHCFLGMNVLNLSPLMWVLIFNGGFVFLWWVWLPWPIFVHALNLCSCTESDTLRGIWVPEWYFSKCVIW